MIEQELYLECTLVEMRGGKVFGPSLSAALAIASASIGSDLPRVRSALATRPSASAAPGPRVRHGDRSARTSRRRGGSPRSPRSAVHRASGPSPAARESPACGPRRSARRRVRRFRSLRRRRCGLLVRVRSDHDHVLVPSFDCSDGRTAGRQTSLGAMPRSYQVRPAILGRRRATQRMKVRPSG